MTDQVGKMIYTQRRVVYIIYYVHNANTVYPEICPFLVLVLVD